MKTIVTRQFEKDVEKELSKALQKDLALLIEEIQKASSLREISNLKKLTGHNASFRIKFGEYRIGFILEKDVIKLSRIMNRKEIYKYFP